MRRQNVKAGIPDYFLAIPKPGFSGCWIEMKRKTEKGKPIRTEQMYWRTNLLDMGYQHFFAYGADEAIDYVKKYIDLP